MSAPTVTITASDGTRRTVPFEGMRLAVGRTADNDVVLEQGGVSSHHCVLSRDPTGGFLVSDQGSTNGTWIGQQRVQGTIQIQPGTQLIVGSYVLSLEFARPAQTPAQTTGPSAAVGMGVRGPLLRKSETEHQDRRFFDRVSRYAREWDEAGRPSRLLLRGRNLRQALEHLDSGQDPDLLFGELEESFVRASAEGRERNKIVRIVGIALGAVAVIGLGVFLATRDWGGSGEGDVAAAEDAGTDTDTGGEEGEVAVAVVGDNDVDDQTEKQWIEHEVIPAETLEEIALRYDVPVQNVMRWNGIGESEALEVGRKLRVNANPIGAPLPYQNVIYETEKRESWSSLSKRFDVPVDKLRAYNPDVGDTLGARTRLSIWIDPKPLKRKADVQIPEFTVREDAISVGAPKNGKLLNGIQFPRRDDLYKRRQPYIMWAGSHMTKYLTRAIASFRYTYEFEGTIVVADMSKKGGGKFDPHRSHQSGRDCDFWLPTLKGVYKKNQLTDKMYRPSSSEADWFALYGLLKALHETGEVQVVFLDYILHDRVYKAAKLMGADDQELEQMIAYPHGPHHRGALLQHSPGHIHHIHIRFKCGPNDVDCVNRADPDPGD